MIDTPNLTSSISRAQRFFFLEPVFAGLLVSLLALGGMTAYGLLVKEALPDLAIPQATVITQWPGADPQTIEQEVTGPIEREIGTIRGLRRVSSASFSSFSIIAVEFQADADMDRSMQLLRATLDDVEGDLPADVEVPSLNQVSVDDRPILTVVLFGDIDEALFGRSAHEIEEQLERVTGVNEVEVGGARDEVVRIDLELRRLLAMGISPVHVRDQIRAANIDMPWGRIASEEFGATTRLYGRFRDLDDLRRLPIERTASGRVVRLQEIAAVRRELERETTRASFSLGGEPFRASVEISIKKVPGSDTVQVIGNVLSELEQLRRSEAWPYGLAYHVTQNQADDIQDSLVEVMVSGLQAMVGVFLVLFIVLTWREGLIAGLSIPLTFLGALVVIWALGFTLNELVIIGMVLALGLLVDVFILMMEGMHDGIYVQQLAFEPSALATVKRYALPALAGQLTTILALTPLMAISGVAGKFIRVLPATAIACLVVALAVALLVNVPLSRYVLKRRSGPAAAKPLASDRLTLALSDTLKRWSLGGPLRTRGVAALWVAGAGSVFVVGLVAFATVPIVMYPPSDGLRLGITVELPASTTLPTSQRVADSLGEVLRAKPYLASVVKLVGKKSPMAQSSLSDALKPSEGEYFVGFSSMFVPREARDRPAYEYADELRRELRELLDSRYAAAQLVVVAETGSPNTDDPVQIEITGSNMERLREISQQVQVALAQIPGATDVRDNLGGVQSEIKLLPRREALDFYGLSEQDVASQILYVMAHSEIGTFAMADLEEDLSLRLGIAWPSDTGAERGPTRMDELANVRVFDSQGAPVPVLAVMEPRLDSVPIAITHKDTQRSVVVMSKTDGRPASEIVDAMTPVITGLQDTWPPNYAAAFAGEAQETAETFGSAGLMLVFAVVLVFAVLVLMFGSFLQSVVIIVTMPLAMIGVFLGFAVFQIPFSFFAMVGVISLIGIVVNNAIVMVDTMNTHLQAGLPVPEAAARGASDRLRPIVSTTVTTVIGLVPLALSDPMWRPLCFAIIFGLLAATVISLVIVPCLYLLATSNSAGAPGQAHAS